MMFKMAQIIVYDDQKSLRAYHEKAPGGVKMAIAR